MHKKRDKQHLVKSKLRYLSCDLIMILREQNQPLLHGQTSHLRQNVPYDC